MKMTTNDFLVLKTAMKERHEYLLSNNEDSYLEYLATHNNKRIAWDLCHFSGMTPFICNTLYTYLNDEHIETALLRIKAQLIK